MAIDCIIAEVRQAREELAKRFNYDLRAMIQDARERQAASGRKVVAFPPRPVRKTTRTQAPRPLVSCGAEEEEVPSGGPLG
jgi:hypothetical protein